MGSTRQGSWGFFFFWAVFSLCTPAFCFNECPFLVATSLTETGGATIASGRFGELHFIEDFFDASTGTPNWNWREQAHGLPAVARRGMVRMDLLKDADLPDGVWFLTQSLDKSVHLVSPNGLPFNIQDSRGETPRAARFYRPEMYFSLRNYGPNLPTAESMRANLPLLPAQLWTAFDDGVYRSSMILKPVPEGFAPALSRALWPVRFKEFDVAIWGDSALESRDGVLQLDPDSDSLHWLPTSTPKFVMKLSPPTKMVVPLMRGGVDFMQILSPSLLVVANEMGEVEVWNYAKGKLVARPRFNDPVWLSGMTAYLNGTNVEVLALAMNGASLYRWKSESGLTWFEKVPDEELPERTAPITAISASSHITPPMIAVAPAVSPAWIRYSPGPLPVRVNRVLLATQDGMLFGTSPGDVLHGEPSREWTPFQVPRNPRSDDDSDAP